MGGAGLQIRVLGPLEVRRDGESIGPGPDATKPRALLALLVLHANRVLSKSTLIDALWGEPPPSAKNLVEKYVSLWRKSLDPGRLDTVGQGYRLNLSAEECDLEDFKERLDQGRRAATSGDHHTAAHVLDIAFRLWRDPHIEDFGRELLQASEAQRLVDLYLQGLEEWAEAALTSGVDIAVTEPLRDAQERYPFRERLSELLMWALLQQGRQNEAGQVYDRTRCLLAEELGQDPGAGLKEMHIRVLRRDPTLSRGRRTRAQHVSNLPPRNRRFTGRVAALEEISRRLERADHTKGASAVAVWGLVGAGKSALALEFAHEHAEEYDCVWWISATTRSSVADGLEALAARLDCPLPADREEHVYRLWDAIRRFRRWLLVLDNAEGPQELADYWPPTGEGDIVITSLNPEWGSHAQPIEVGVFSPSESVTLLRDRTGSRDPATDVALAAELGHLPLAIEQAAAYMNQTGMTAAQYLPLFRRRRTQLLDRGAPDDHTGTIETTWRLASAELSTIAPAAVQLLYLCAFLASEDIPMGLLTCDSDVLPPELREAVRDELQIEDVIREIRKYSLVNRDQDRLRMHCLVQAVIATSVLAEERQAWRQRTARILMAWAPRSASEPETWAAWQLLVPHVRIAAAACAEAGSAPPGFVDVLHRTSAYLVSRASFAEARVLLVHALSLVEATAVDEDDPEIGRTLTELGEVLERCGDVKAALSAQERALAILQRSYGPDDPWVARAIGRLGNLLTCHHGVTLWRTEELSVAEVRFVRALAVLEPTLGHDHPVVAHTLSGLGQVRQDRGDLASGQECQERALEILERAYGPEHPDVGHQCDKLAHVVGLRRDLTRSRALFERALAILKKNYGSEHVEIGWPLSNLGVLLLESGSLDEALEYQRRAHAVFQAGLGTGHPTQIAAWRLARVHLRLGQPDVARGLLEVAVPSLEGQLGPQHHDAVGARADLEAAVAACGHA